MTLLLILSPPAPARRESLPVRGTVDKHSDVAQGLANTLQQILPRKFWLGSSASEISTPVAEQPPKRNDHETISE